MPASPKFGGPVLSKCALKGNSPIEKDGCVVQMRLSKPMSVWDMDHKEIEGKALNIRSKRCDVAAYQSKNPIDGKSHLVLAECQKQLRPGHKSLLYIRNQLVGGLKVLRLMAGEGNFAFDDLTPMLVYREEYLGAIGILQDSEQYRIPHNGRKLRIRTRRSGRAIDDQFVAVKGPR